MKISRKKFESELEKAYQRGRSDVYKEQEMHNFYLEIDQRLREMSNRIDGFEKGASFGAGYCDKDAKTNGTQKNGQRCRHAQTSAF